jgi:hypothetical protein
VEEVLDRATVLKVLGDARDHRRVAGGEGIEVEAVGHGRGRLLLEHVPLSGIEAAWTRTDLGGKRLVVVF